MKLADLLPSHKAMMEGPRPAPDFECDGCTCSPDCLPLVDLDWAAACVWHDWYYRKIGDGTEADRAYADLLLYRNMLRCGASARVAGIYYRRVRLWGWRAFRHASHPGPWQLTKLAIGRYLAW